jgi:transposase
MQKVAALRRYLRGPVKSDRVDALTLAKMPFIDPEHLDEVYLPPAEIHILQRLTRQRKRLESEVGGHKIRIGAMVESYLPGIRRAFNNTWSLQVRAFFKTRLNPFAVVREGEEALHMFLSKTCEREWSRSQTRHVFLVCQGIVSICEQARAAGVLTEDFFTEFQEEIAREMRMLEMAEGESDSVGCRIEEIYRKLHPSNNLQSIPGVGEHTAPVFLAAVGDPLRFSNQAAFANWEGVVPGARQSSNMEIKGLHMTKAGPSIVRMALYQAGDMARRYDPQLAAVYYREMVQHGKNHRQAMGAVMSHLGARVLSVLRDGRPYELRTPDGKPISWNEAKQLISSEFRVPEEVRRERRINKAKSANKGEMTIGRTCGAADAPQT